MRPGIEMLEETTGSGPQIKRRHVYLLRLKFWLNKGDPVRWASPSGFVDRARLEDDGETLIADFRIDRESLVNGLFQGIQGMRIGGTRKLRISPHLAYGDRGIPGLIPENAVIVAEVCVLEERVFAR